MAKNVFITGANKGIGFETARRLGEQGYRIWLGARDVERGETAAQILRNQGHDVRYIDIDVVDDSCVRAAAERVMKEDGSLDVLINNAGIPGNYAPPLGQGLDDIRKVYDINLFSPIRVIYALLPVLKAAGKANIVNVSTGLASLGWLTDPDNQYYDTNLLGYNSSKTALNAVTVSLAKALVPFYIRVNSADPGYTKTDFTNNTGNHTVVEAAEVIVTLATSDEHGPNAGFFNMDGPLPW